MACCILSSSSRSPPPPRRRRCEKGPLSGAGGDDPRRRRRRPRQRALVPIIRVPILLLLPFLSLAALGAVPDVVVVADTAVDGKAEDDVKTYSLYTVPPFEVHLSLAGNHQHDSNELPLHLLSASIESKTTQYLTEYFDDVLQMEEREDKGWSTLHSVELDLLLQDDVDAYEAEGEGDGAEERRRLRLGASRRGQAAHGRGVAEEGRESEGGLTPQRAERAQQLRRLAEPTSPQPPPALSQGRASGDNSASHRDGSPSSPRSRELDGHGTIHLLATFKGSAIFNDGTSTPSSSQDLISNDKIRSLVRAALSNEEQYVDFLKNTNDPLLSSVVDATTETDLDLKGDGGHIVHGSPPPNGAVESPEAQAEEAALSRRESIAVFCTGSILVVSVLAFYVYLSKQHQRAQVGLDKNYLKKHHALLMQRRLMMSEMYYDRRDYKDGEEEVGEGELDRTMDLSEDEMELQQQQSSRGPKKDEYDIERDIRLMEAGVSLQYDIGGEELPPPPPPPGGPPEGPPGSGRQHGSRQQQQQQPQQKLSWTDIIATSVSGVNTAKRYPQPTSPISSDLEGASLGPVTDIDVIPVPAKDGGAASLTDRLNHGRRKSVGDDEVVGRRYVQPASPFDVLYGAAFLHTEMELVQQNSSNYASGKSSPLGKNHHRKKKKKSSLNGSGKKKARPITPMMSIAEEEGPDGSTISGGAAASGRIGELAERPGLSPAGLMSGGGGSSHSGASEGGGRSSSPNNLSQYHPANFLRTMTERYFGGYGAHNPNGPHSVDEGVVDVPYRDFPRHDGTPCLMYTGKKDDGEVYRVQRELGVEEEEEEEVEFSDGLDQPSSPIGPPPSAFNNFTIHEEEDDDDEDYEADLLASDTFKTKLGRLMEAKSRQVVERTKMEQEKEARRKARLEERRRGGGGGGGGGAAGTTAAAAGAVHRSDKKKRDGSKDDDRTSLLAHVDQPDDDEDDEEGDAAANEPDAIVAGNEVPQVSPLEGVGQRSEDDVGQGEKEADLLGLSSSPPPPQESAFSIDDEDQNGDDGTNDDAARSTEPLVPPAKKEERPAQGDAEVGDLLGMSPPPEQGVLAIADDGNSPITEESLPLGDAPAEVVPLAVVQPLVSSPGPDPMSHQDSDTEDVALLDSTVGEKSALVPNGADGEEREEKKAESDDDGLGGEFT